ncbi:MAG: endolytic transglycosylase MltG [Lachnospiraceae bacterium]|nr:endolytic transglycosylase MltG [Lachnospiraceae bacterium]
MSKQKKKSSGTALTVSLFLFRTALLLFIIAAIIRIGESAYSITYRVVSDAAIAEEPGRDISVTINSSMTDRDIAEILEKKGLIESSSVFRIQLKLFQYDGELQPGSYILNTSMTPSEMMAEMAGEEESEDTDDE